MGLAAVIAAMSLTIGIERFLMVQLPITLLSGTLGVYLFYVQHQFEGVYWERHENWDYLSAALKGSSFYKLPKVLQWFTGSIGFHHIHHLSPRIPNYYLQPCHEENSIFQVKPITLSSSLKSLTFRLWDEDNRRLVGYKSVKSYRQVPEAG